METKRETWLDIIKVIAIFLVTILHIANAGIGFGEIHGNQIMYYFGTFAVPLFFMVNGYLNLNGVKSYKYSLKKIINILVVILGWNILYFIFDFIINNNVNNLFCMILDNFLQRGVFWQFWFLGSLIIIYLFIPIISRIFNKTKYYKLLVLGLFLLCLAYNFINIFILKDKILIKIIPQALRLWTWIFYLCLGGLVRKENILNNISNNKYIIITFILILITVLYEFTLAMHIYNRLEAENFYDSILVIITTYFIFTCFKKIEFKNSNVISIGGSLTLGVYIIHIFVLELFRKFITMNNYYNFLIAIIVFIISYLLTIIIAKIPVLNKLVKI